MGAGVEKTYTVPGSNAYPVRLRESFGQSRSARSKSMRSVNEMTRPRSITNA